MTDNPVSRAANVYRTVTVNPTINAGMQGAVGAGVGYTSWDRMMSTLRSLLRRPVAAMTRMSPREFDEEWEEIQKDKKMRIIIPSSIGASIMGLSLLTSYRPNEAHGGLLSWNDDPKPLDKTVYRGYRMPNDPNLEIKKTAALKKLANDMFEYGGFVPRVDFSQVFDAPAMRQELFSNDPWMKKDPLTQYRGISILADAQNRAGSSNVSLGNLYDSAMDKFKTKFSLMGVTGIAAKTMFANAASDLLVNAIGTMLDVPQETREDLISAGTWYGAAKAILT